MLSAVKICVVMTVLLVVTAVIPAIGVMIGYQPMGVMRGQQHAPSVLLAAVAFIMGLWVGGMALPVDRITAHQVPPRTADRSLSQLAVLAAVLMCFLIASGAPPVLLGAFDGSTSHDLVVAREEIAKLNPNKLQVRTISFLRDMVGPMLLIPAIAYYRLGYLGKTKLLISIALSVVALVWTAQKSPLATALLSTMVWFSWSRGSFARTAWWWIFLSVIAVVAASMITQPDLWMNASSPAEYTSRLLGGVFERVMVTPFEVTCTYVHAAELGEIGWRNAIPFYAFIWQPCDETADAIVGQQYFSGGYDSTLSGALCFGYPYVIGGLPLCLVCGFMVVPALAVSTRIVKTAGLSWVQLLYSTYLTTLVIDGVQGNLLQYLLNNVFVASGVAIAGPLFISVWQIWVRGQGAGGASK